MVSLVLMLVVQSAVMTTDRPTVVTPKNEAMAEVLASWAARAVAKLKPNEGIGVREERVTFRSWSESDKRFNKPIEEVDASRIDRRSGGTTFLLSSKQMTDGRPPAKSEIIDKDGCVWVVGSVEESGGGYACSVRKK
jgi:hypothetical protein